MKIEEICKKYGGTHSSINLDTNNLNYGGDLMSHGYHKFYEKYFSPFQEDKNINLLEIGVFKGGGLVVWSDYFPEGKIYGIDIGIQDYLLNIPKYKSRGGYSNNNVKVCKGDSTNKETWGNEIEEYPLMDIIIDDGHHIPKSNKATLENFWEKLKPQGIYVIEDIRPPYLKEVEEILNKKDLRYETEKGNKGEYIIFITK